MTNSMVLLSGGLDSVAALLFERKVGAEHVEAVFFDYGQPMRKHERAAARAVCEATGTWLHERDLAPVFSAFSGGLMASPSSERDATGRDTAFLPGRNAVLISVAASLAHQLWPYRSSLVVGFNSGDAGGFPDCRREFCEAMEETLQKGGTDVRIRAPWVASSKRQIVEWVRREAPGAARLLDLSWSCYSADGPCRLCTACVTRAEALA